MRLAISTCNCCGNKLVPCVVTKAGILPEFSTCKGCDTTGAYVKLSTYKK